MMWKKAQEDVRDVIMTGTLAHRPYVPPNPNGETFGMVLETAQFKGCRRKLVDE